MRVHNRSSDLVRAFSGPQQLTPWEANIICHMLPSMDGDIDGTSLKGLTPAGEYETTGAQLDGHAWVCGRTRRP